MSSAEFTKWKAYAAKHPFGYLMDNYRAFVPAAELMNTINSTVKWKRKPRKWKASDLSPSEKKRAPDLTPEQQEHIRKKHGKRRNSHR
jgi:hypothetical protein